MTMISPLIRKTDLLRKFLGKQIYCSVTNHLFSTQQLKQEEMVLEQTKQRLRGGVVSGNGGGGDAQPAPGSQNVTLKVPKVGIEI